MDPAPFKVAVIGAGFSGIGAAVMLRKRFGASVEVVVFEKDEALGGTWRKNSYPGVACDVPSHFYSLSFAPNPLWDNHYSEGADILRYLKRVADEFKLDSCFRFNSVVQSCHWDGSHWEVKVKNVISEQVESGLYKYVIASSSPLSEPVIPDISGIESFKGQIFHSARWNHDLDLSNKSVAVVGTGASAIQIVPSIIDKVKSLTLFQRTPAWVVPRLDFAYPTIVKKLFQYVPWIHSLFRYAIYLYSDVRYWGVIRRLPFLSNFNEWMLRHLIRREVRNPVVSEALIPSYSLGCKRLLVSDDYYKCFNKETMTLVPSELISVGENFVSGKDGVKRPVDAIIFATGFDILAGLGDLEISGTKGTIFTNFSKDKNKLPGAYLGSYFHGLPNMFFTLGPNSGLGHSSVVCIIEIQLLHINKLINTAEQRKAKSVEVKKQAVDDYNSQIQRDLLGTVWESGGCSSWYRTQGTGKNTVLWPWTIAWFRIKSLFNDTNSFDFDV